MYYLNREDIRQSIAKLGDQRCCYSGGAWIKRRCDCKYGGPNSSVGSEQTGCPELRDVYLLLANLSDEEYDAIMKRTSPGGTASNLNDPQQIVSRYYDFESDTCTLSVVDFYKKYADIFQKYVPEYFLNEKNIKDASVGTLQVQNRLIETYQICRQRFQKDILKLETK